jgi:hypothetical protein
VLEFFVKSVFFIGFIEFLQILIFAVSGFGVFG